MGQPAAKRGDQVTGTDTHVVMLPSPTGPVPTPMPLPFAGPLQGLLSDTVFVDGSEAATAGSEADNTPPHIAPGGSFQSPPSNKATIESGSSSVFVDDRAAARNGDPASTCNDPTDLPLGTVVASGTVIVA